MNPYKVLGVNLQDDLSVIRKRYLHLVKVHHPDRSTGNVLEFRKVQEAWESIVKSKESQDQQVKEGEKYGVLDITHISLFRFKRVN